MTIPLIVPIQGVYPGPLPSGPSNKRRSCLDDLPSHTQVINAAPDHGPALNDAGALQQKAKKNSDQQRAYSIALTNATRSAMVAKCDQNEAVVDEGNSDAELEKVFVQMNRI